MIKRTLKDGRTVTARQNGGIRKRCGCARSKWTDCSHPWHGNFSYNGQEHRVSLHKWAKKTTDYVMLQGEAKTLWRSWVTAIEGGKETPAAKAATLTLDTIAKDYIAEYVQIPERRKRAAAEMERLVKALQDTTITPADGVPVRLGSLPAASFTKATIEAFRTARRQAHEATIAADPERIGISSKGGRVATNRLLTRLRHVFTWAIADKGLLEVTPFSKGGVSVVKLDTKAEAGRTRRLEGDEETRLLAAAGPHLRACIEAALETGMRKGEILGLRWQDVRTTLGIIDLPASITKTGVGRQVVITPRVAAILEMRATEQRTTRELAADADLPSDLHPFGNELGEAIQDCRTAWRLTCKRAGIAGLHFHDLRRESGSQLIEAGASLTDVRDYLGHASVTQTNKYLSTSAARLQVALAKRDAARTNLAQPPQADESADAAPTVTH